jgi:putative transcriptional regulator
MAKRNIFGELMEGAAAMKNHREGKLTLRSYKVDVMPLPKVDSKLLRDTRKKLRCSRAVFARKLRINERTLEKWEQGRAKPNPQAAALVLLVRKYPDTLARLDALANGETRSPAFRQQAKGRAPGVTSSIYPCTPAERLLPHRRARARKRHLSQLS